MKKNQILKSKLYNFLYRFLTPMQRIEKIIKRPKYIKLNTSDYLYWNKEYEKWVSKLTQKVNRQEKIKVGFIIYFTCSFSAENIMNKMLDDNIFEPEIIVVPTELVFSKEKTLESYRENLENVKEKYKDKITILEAYDEKTGKITDYSKQFDIIFTPSNDERIAPPEYKIYNFIKNKTLCCYISYSFQIVNSDGCFSDTENLVWKYFIENKMNRKYLYNKQPLKAKNTIITGYVKSDSFYGLEKQKSDRKIIIIAPHHSVHEVGLCSRFLQYSDFFLRLPAMYPEIDFIFRPHPLLRNTLNSPEFWGEEKTNQYFEKVVSYPNMKYDISSEYYQTFINSDGIIHDCGSFLAEYLYTGNPCCYTLKNDETINYYFNEFGKACLENYYQAFNEKDIIQFIEKVVMQGIDTQKDKRTSFTNNILKEYYPNATKNVINYLRNSIIKEVDNDK
ncbi:MAG: hypothetical protein KIC80_04980 [Brachyspira sp.]|nr:hypothetical protein [Brachyspira sp.]